MKFILPILTFGLILFDCTSAFGQNKKKSFLLSSNVSYNNNIGSSSFNQFDLLPEFTWFVKPNVAIGIHAIGIAKFDQQKGVPSTGDFESFFMYGGSLDWYRSIFDDNKWSFVWNFRLSIQSRLAVNSGEPFFLRNIYKPSAYKMGAIPGVQYQFNDKYALLVNIGELSYQHTFGWNQRPAVNLLQLRYGLDSFRLGFRYTFEKKKKTKSSPLDKIE